MNLKKKVAFAVMSALAISGITLLGAEQRASACTGFWGSLDPTCDHGGILNPVHLATLDFKICNYTGGVLSYNVNGMMAEPLLPNYCTTFTNWPEPGTVSFDASYADGVQEMSYYLSDEGSYYFAINQQGYGIDLYSE